MMPQTLSLEEFDARYAPPAVQPRTLTLEQFDAREDAPAGGRFADEPQGLEGIIRSLDTRSEDRERQRSELLSTPRPAEEPGFFAHLGRSGERGFRSLQQLRNLYGMQLGEDPETNIARIAELERVKRSLPASEALQKFGRAKTFDEAFGAFLDAPLDVSGNLAVESLAQFATGLLLAAGVGA
ncbi:MAG: hypothetical protein IH927_08200, partial [Proteobacteria bacterium]|nr:hypothetical protein [Pseudomonadota bacterium]